MGWIPRSLLRRICSFTEVRHSRMLLAGIQPMFETRGGDDPCGSVEDSTGLGVRFHPIPTRAREKFLERLGGGKT